MNYEISEPEQNQSKTAIQLILLLVVSVVYYFGFDIIVNWLGGLKNEEYAKVLGAQVSLKIALEAVPDVSKWEIPV